MKTDRAPTGFRLALVYMGLLLVTGLAFPTAAGAQGRGEHDAPEELWKIYPLDPTKAEGGALETIQPQQPQPAPAQTDSIVQTTSESPKAQPSGEFGIDRSLALPLLGAFLGLLVGLLVVTAVRHRALATGGEHPARGGSAVVSPLPAATTAPRYVGRGGAAVVSPLRALPRLPHYIGSLLLWPLRVLASVITYVVRGISFGVAAPWRASRTVLREREESLYRLLFSFYRLLFYVFILVACAGVGLLVTLLLQP